MFKVLVLEDDIELQQLYCRVLSLKRLSAFRGGLSRKKPSLLWKHDHIDLVITDVMMPGIDGFEFVKTLRDGGNTAPILMITAKDSFRDKQIGFMSGVDDYMVKPVDVNEMVLRVGALLRRAKSVSERKQAFGKTVLEYDTLTGLFGRNGNHTSAKRVYVAL